MGQNCQVIVDLRLPIADWSLAFGLLVFIAPIPFSRVLSFQRTKAESQRPIGNGFDARRPPPLLFERTFERLGESN